MTSSPRGFFVACLALIGGLQLSEALTTTELDEFYTGSADLDIWDESHNYTDYTALTSYMSIESKTKNGKNYHYFQFNGVPDYSDATLQSAYKDWGALGGNKKLIVSQTYEKCIPETPTLVNDPPLDSACSDTHADDHENGFVGITVNETPLWAWHTSSAGDAVSDEVMDTCGGHPNADGKYHLHGYNADDFDTLNENPGCIADFDLTACPAPLMGVALDGFSIYGPQKCDTDGNYQGLYTSSELTDGWREIDGTQDGDSVKTAAGKSYEYRMYTDQYYHITCFIGETVALGRCKNTKRGNNARDEMVAEAKEQADLENKIERTLLEILLNKKIAKKDYN